MTAHSKIIPSDSITDRKADHIRLCLEDIVQCQQTTPGFERYRFTHTCLPELEAEAIALKTQFLGQSVQAPLLISSMTGGTELAKEINQRLARAAQRYGLAMGVGSQRVAIEKPQTAHTFHVRDLAPDVPLYANVGAVQLNYGYGVEHCLRAVEGLDANALILHLNPLQECIQSQGDTNFKGVLAKIEALCAALPVPVIAKEVGNGISAAMAKPLIQAGVAAIDVAGAGGTSWAKVEGERATDEQQRRLGQTFAEWGIPTADCLVDIRTHFPAIPIIASGGVRNGLDAAKAIALGGNLVGLASPFLKAACESEAALAALIEVLIAEIRTVLFCTGHGDLGSFQRSPGLTSIP
jgi:isopentenyl-diphosphate delta-isomerase